MEQISELDLLPIPVFAPPLSLGSDLQLSWSLLALAEPVKIRQTFMHYNINTSDIYRGGGTNVAVITCVGCVRLTEVTVWFTIAPADPWAPENTCKSFDAEKDNRSSHQTGNDGTRDGEMADWFCHLRHYSNDRPVAGVFTSTDVGCNTEGSWAGGPVLSDDAITTLSAGTSCWELNWLVAWGWAGCLACSRMLCWTFKHINCLRHTAKTKKTRHIWYAYFEWHFIVCN